MKQLLWTLAVVLTLGTLAACSKDDEPGGAGKDGYGYFKIEDKTVKLKYGYEISEDGSRAFYFSDKDLTKESSFSENRSTLIVDFQSDNTIQVGFEYNVNYSAETGYYYDFETTASSGLIQSELGANSNVKISGECPRMSKYNFETDEQVGYFDGSFAVSGKVQQISETRSLEVQKITDPIQIARIKAISKRK